MKELPEPVERYFRFAGVRHSQVAPAIRMEQEGTFLLGRRWLRFHAEQYVDPSGPAFIWNASIRLALGLWMRVQDSYSNGTGRIDAYLAGLLRVVHREDRDLLAAGELHRYLAEAVWNPAALTSGSGVTWEPMDRRSARASLSADGITVTLDFLFDDSGRIVQAYTPARARDVSGKSVLTPWLCKFQDYLRLNRQMVPAVGEVAWCLPEGVQPYCRLKVTQLRTLSRELPRPDAAVSAGPPVHSRAEE